MLPQLHQLASRVVAILASGDGVVGRLPLTVTKKLQRVGMAGRLGLPEIADATPPVQRLFEATCPAGPSSPQQVIPCAPINIDVGERCGSPFSGGCALAFSLDRYLVTHFLLRALSHFLCLSWRKGSSRVLNGLLSASGHALLRAPTAITSSMQ